MRDAFVVRAAEAILGLVERSLLLVSVAPGDSRAPTAGFGRRWAQIGACRVWTAL